MADKDFRIDLILGAKFAEGFRAIDEAKRKLEGAERAAGKFSKTGAALGSALRTAGYAGIAAASAATAVMGLYIEKTIEAEKVQSQLKAAIRDTGGVAGRTLEQLNNQAAKIQNVTVFDDEAVGNAQAMLLTFTQIRGLNFDRTIEAAADLATKMGTDITAAAKQLGTALSDPIKGMEQLRRSGVTFTESEKDTIRTMIEHGQIAEAQGTILDALSRKMGGAAEAARNTLGGALQALKGYLDNVIEGDSGDEGVVGLRNAVETFIRTLQDPSTRAGVQEFIGDLVQIANFAAQAISAIGGMTQAVKDAFAADAQKSYLGLLSKRADLVDDLANVTSNSPLKRSQVLLGGASGDVNPFARQTEAAEVLRAKIEQIDRLLQASGLASPRKTRPGLFDAGGPLAFKVGGNGFSLVNPVPFDPNAGLNPAPEGEGVAKPGKVPKTRAGKKDDPDAAAKDYLADLQRQIALLGQVKEGEDQASEAAKAHYEVTEGKFKNASQAVKDQIEAAAKALDAQTKEREETEKAKEAYDDLLKELRTPAEVAVDDAIAKINTLSEALKRGQESSAQFNADVGKVIGDQFSKPLDGSGNLGEYNPLAELDSDRARIEADYQARLAMLAQYRQQRADLNALWDQKEAELEAQHQAALVNLQVQQGQMLLGLASSTFGQMAEVAKQFGGEQSRTYRVLFAISKGFAVAQSAVSLATNISKASEYGFPQNLPFIAGAIAQGAQILSILAGANYAGGGGGYAEGGYTGPGGKHEPAGIVHKGEGVLTQEEIAKLGGPAGFYALQEEIQAGRARAVLRGFAEGGLVGLEDQNRTPMPDFAAMAPRGATVKNSMRVYLLNNEDDLAQRIASHPANEKAIVAVVSENGNAIKARW